MEDESDGWETVSLGPMTDAEKESLLALAEELRRRNIDLEAWGRALFVDPPARKSGKGGRHPAASDKEARDERLLAAYRSTLGLLQKIDRGTPPEATTVRGIREDARIDLEGATLRLKGDGFTPYLEAVAAYREGLRGALALDVRAAMLAFGMDDPAEASSALRALQARVRNRKESQAPE